MRLTVRLDMTKSSRTYVAFARRLGVTPVCSSVVECCSSHSARYCSKRASRSSSSMSLSLLPLDPFFFCFVARRSASYIRLASNTECNKKNAHKHTHTFSCFAFLAALAAAFPALLALAILYYDRAPCSKKKNKSPITLQSLYLPICRSSTL